MGYCTWADINEANRIYHDTEWGIPVHDDRHMFEHLSLECLQCGLSWDLMLKKREIFRRCFDNFDYDKIAAYDDADVERILNTESMIRSRRKVEAAGDGNGEADTGIETVQRSPFSRRATGFDNLGRREITGTDGSLRERRGAGEQHEGCGKKGNNLFHTYNDNVLCVFLDVSKL